jgi:hypothetical protein
MSTGSPPTLPRADTSACPELRCPPGRPCRRGAPAAVWLAVLLVAACTHVRAPAVPERQLALRVALPLTAVAREEAVRFISAGGRLGKDGTAERLPAAVEVEFGALLDALRDAAALRFDQLEGRVRRLIPAAERKTPVIDATEEYPDEVGRVGYLLGNFWFVFYAQKEDAAGPLPATQWRFTRLVIFRDRPPA